jgi:hypothetical protein
MYTTIRPTEKVAQLKEKLLELKKQYNDTDDQYPELEQVHKVYF